MTKRLILIVCFVFWFTESTSAKVIKHPEKFPGRYVVVLKPLIEDDIDLIAEELTAKHNALLKKVWRNNLKGFLIEMPANAAEKLSNDPRVESVEEDGLVRITAGSIPDQIDRIDQDQLPMDGIYASCTSGAGVRAYVVDTGIRRDHEQFIDPPSCPGQPSTYRVQPESMSYNGVDPSFPLATDPCRQARYFTGGHGTWVASVLGGRMWGAARGATLISVRVFDCFGRAYISTVVSGLDWIEGPSDLNRFTGNGGRVVNLSFGFKTGNCDPSGAPTTSGAMGALDSAVMGLIGRGVTVVAAAANFREDVSLYSPARVGEVITEEPRRALTRSGWFLHLRQDLLSTPSAGATTQGLASGTNVGAGVDVFAIAHNVTSADYNSVTGIRAPISVLRRSLGSRSGGPVSANVSG